MVMERRKTTNRGYGAEHQAERKRWKSSVEAGAATCWRCLQPIDPTGPWDLGHNDERTEWMGPEHVGCNRSAGGRNGAAVANERKQHTVRDW